MDLILNIQLAESGADVTACALFKDTSDLPEGVRTMQQIDHDAWEEASGRRFVPEGY